MWPCWGDEVSLEIGIVALIEVLHDLFFYSIFYRDAHILVCFIELRLIGVTLLALSSCVLSIAEAC